MKKQKILTLEKQIKQAAQDYYTGKATITDARFDMLVDELREVDPSNKTVNTVGWGYDINAVKGDKVAHKYSSVGSLSKIHSVSEIPSSFNAGAILTAKLDGASCVAYYENGSLVKAVTRGNGITGVDKTKHYEKVISKYNVRVNNFTGAIRGEIVFSNNAWYHYKEKYPNAKFPRNIATGLFMRDEVTEDLEFIDFVPYKIQGCETPNLFTSQRYTEILMTLRSWGFPQMECKLVDTLSLSDESLLQLFNTWKQYPMDGIVIQNRFFSVNNDNGFEYTDIAYKFKAEEKLTTVKEVKWSLSKNNIMVPVVHVEPVELSGAVVQKTSGFNYKYIMDNNIGPGAVIKLMRSGEVIPYITEVVKPSLDLVKPENCPVCGMPLSADGVELLCSNSECDNIEYARLISWLKVIGIRDLLGVGDIMLEEFVQMWVQTLWSTVNVERVTVQDIYNKEYGIVANREFLLNKLTPASKLKFSTVIDNLTKEITMDKFLVAINVRGLGDTVCKKIASVIYDCILDWSQVDKITEIDGIGNDVKNRVLNARKIISKLFCLVPILEPKKPGFLTSHTQITVTGSLSMPRKQFETVCATKNIVLSDNVKSSKYVVTNDPNSGSSKLAKAAKYNIPIISETEFRKIFGV